MVSPRPVLDVPTAAQYCRHTQHLLCLQLHNRVSIHTVFAVPTAAHSSTLGSQPLRAFYVFHLTRLRLFYCRHNHLETLAVSDQLGGVLTKRDYFVLSDITAPPQRGQQAVHKHACGAQHAARDYRRNHKKLNTDGPTRCYGI